MLKYLSEEEVLLKLLEERLVCGKCGRKMKPIGKKFLRHEMQIILEQMKLLADCWRNMGYGRFVFMIYGTAVPACSMRMVSA